VTFRAAVRIGSGNPAGPAAARTVRREAGKLAVLPAPARRMDRPFLDSLLQHPIGRALVVLDCDGKWLHANASARDLLGGALLAAVRPRLELAFVQLLAHPTRIVRWQQAGPEAALDCVLAAALCPQAGVRGFTLSLSDSIESDDDGRWRYALEHADEGLWDWDLVADRVHYSPRWRAMLGLADAVGDSPEVFRGRLHPDDRKPTLRALTAKLREGDGRFELEYRMRHSDGRWLWLRSRGRAVAFSPQGEPLRMLGSHLDIGGRKLLEGRLRNREWLLAQAQLLGQMGLVTWRARDRRLRVSDGFLRLSGREQAPTRFRDIAEMATASSRQALRPAIERLLLGGAPVELNLDLQHPDGGVRHLAVRGESLRSADGTLERLIGVVQDVTRRRQAEDAAQHHTEMLDRIASVGRIGGWELNLLTGELHWTEQNYRIHGIPVGTPVSVESTRNMYEGRSREVFEAAVARVIAGERDEDTIEVQFITPNEERIWLRITGRAERRDGRPFRVTGLTRDITEEREASERIEQLAHYDSLTGLPNRFQFRELAAGSIAAARRNGKALALLFLDLDRFKNVNDSLGHEAGDQLLLDVAGRVRACVRAGDVVARQGGDEFLVLLRELKRPEDAGRVARKIIDAVGRPVQLGEAEVQVGVSIGIALLSDASDTLEALLRAADTAMYAAKDAGRNGFQFYSDSFYARVQRKLTLEQELRQALGRNELSLVYQPTIDLRDGRVRGIETLLRWQTAGGEQRAPTEFIPIAEDCGEILPIGLWVLEQACAQARQWDRDGLCFERIAVNVSALQLRDADFGAQVIETCERSDWPPERLELELTESALMRDSDTLRRAFALFETHGVSLSVDDFGTGFSNLHYLHRFPIQHLKIDRSFVLNLLADQTLERLSEAIVGLGHALRLRVIGEGVETEEVAARLRELRCDEAQGYLFTRPLPADRLADWIRARSGKA
jgi:diguanylate cyclase (GGDEF)-like protein/PAS domain S-box-containing protein